MKTFFIVSILLFTACGQSNERFNNVGVNNNQGAYNAVADEKEFDTLPTYNENIYREYIPQKLVEFLAKELPGWKIPAPDNWDKFWFNEYKTSTKLINYISLDLNCDKQTDYALILAAERGELATWLFTFKKNGFEKMKLESYGSGWEQIGVGLEVLEPGKHNYINPSNYNTKPVKIECQAVNIIGFEKTAEAYYFDKGRIKSIITGD